MGGQRHCCCILLLLLLFICWLLLVGALAWHLGTGVSTEEETRVALYVTTVALLAAFWPTAALVITWQLPLASSNSISQRRQQQRQSSSSSTTPMTPREPGMANSAPRAGPASRSQLQRPHNHDHGGGDLYCD
jgi:hypothetical protein